MGYTTFTKQLVSEYISEYRPKYVIDLGAQNDFSGPNLPAPYISEWYKSQGIQYECIDLNAENNAHVDDLSKVFKQPNGFQWDLVCDIGTGEHVGDNGKFSWEAFYNCWLNKWNLCTVGGLIISENPMTGNWPKHGFNYLDTDFYYELCRFANADLLDTGTQAATGNTIDGWNVWGVIRKYGDGFMSLDEFKTLPIKQS
jgi:hypothetical protein